VFDYSATAKRTRLELYGLKEMNSKTKNLAVSMLQRPPLNRFFVLVKAGQQKLYVKPTLTNLRLETLLMAA